MICNKVYLKRGFERERARGVYAGVAGYKYRRDSVYIKIRVKQKKKKVPSHSDKRDENMSSHTARRLAPPRNGSTCVG